MADEKTGFHKGAIQTLIGEKSELLKMINTVDQLILAHNNALKEQGIDYIEELKKSQEQQEQQEPSSSEEEIEIPEPEEEQPEEYDDYEDYEEPEERLP